MRDETNGGLTGKIERVFDSKLLTIGARFVSLTLAPAALAIFFWLAQNVIDLRVITERNNASLQGKIDVVVGITRNNDARLDRNERRMDRIEDNMEDLKK